MERARHRQFGDVRQSQKGSIKDNTSVTSSVYQPLVKNPHGEACNSCINKIMAEFMRRQLKREKKKQQREQKKNLEAILAMNNPQQQWRQQQQKQALKHNKQLISKQQNEKEEAKMSESKIRSFYEQSEQKFEKQLKEMFKGDKERNKKYREQLYQQVQDQQKRKKEQIQKDKQPILIPFMEASKSYDEKQYRNFLKKQIQEKEKKKFISKQEQIQEEKALQKQFENLSKKYRPNGTPEKTYNPEVFFELTKLTNTKRQNNLHDRLEKERQRKKSEKQDQEIRNQLLKNKFNSIKVYAEELNHQMSERRKRQAEQNNFFEKEINPYQEDEFTRNRQFKNCQQCNRTVPAEHIAKIPELV